MTSAYDPAAEVAEICRDLIRIDTTNFGDGSGPGERSAAEHVAALLAEVGIESQLFEAAPGRASVVAQWGGAGTGDGPDERLLVHGHLDVVPAAAADWKVDPFSGEVADGYLWGRGAVDMKDFDAAILSVVRARARAGAPPRRPLTLAFTADEEAGSRFGAHRLVDERPEWFAGCTEAIGEVGGFSTTVGDRRVYLVQTAEKGIAWLRLRAHGTAGHGSMRNVDNAVTALAEAVSAIGRHEWPVRMTPAMHQLLEAVAALTGHESPYDDVDALLAHFGPAARMLAAVVRNSANPTMLASGYKHNVIPGEATAAIDGRFLPGYEDEFFETLRGLLPDSVSYEILVHETALQTTFDGALVDAMQAAILAADPDADVLPFLMPGGTDAKAWSRLGIRCFGFSPLRLPPDLDFTALFHGVDERVPLGALEFSARVFDDFLDRA
ncbi:MAG TPA: M20/M25/M40 family metallo-hydrolase [Nocardioidaceae bacterium]|nr:M20/M25/M40 family metallo-hydrolase [Nocardioidaceae bacterium]